MPAATENRDLPRPPCKRPALQSEAVEFCPASCYGEGRHRRAWYIGEGCTQAGRFLQSRAEGPRNGQVVARPGDREGCRSNFADQVMGRYLRRRQCSAVNGDFIDPACVIVRPAI